MAEKEETGLAIDERNLESFVEETVATQLVNKLQNAQAVRGWLLEEVEDTRREAAVQFTEHLRLLEFDHRSIEEEVKRRGTQSVLS